MKTVISAAGNLKRENPSMDEVSAILRGTWEQGSRRVLQRLKGHLASAAGADLPPGHP